MVGALKGKRRCRVCWSVVGQTSGESEEVQKRACVSEQRGEGVQLCLN